MELRIEKLDHKGRGIAHLDGKVFFVENALPDEVVLAEEISSKAGYSEARVLNHIEKSDNRIKSKCPIYEECGGCHLRHMSYDDGIEFKKNKVKEIFAKYASISPEIAVIKSKNRDFYRNKIELHVHDGVYGFYKKGSHDLVECDRCLNAEEAINVILRSTNLLHMNEGKITIKCNYNGEIILVIESIEKPEIEIERLREKVKLVGIILNGEPIFGADHFIEIVGGLLFKETYDSFFQINREVNENLFNIIRENVSDGATVLDICCGVGTLSLVAAKKAKTVYGIEIVENSIKDALINAKMNKIENVNFILGDAFNAIDKIQDKIDAIIIDPPRSGLTEKAISSILSVNPEKVVYVSCDPVTLARDLKGLNEKYAVEKVYLLDMFPYTYHVESVSLLKLKSVDK